MRLTVFLFMILIFTLQTCKKDQNPVTPPVTTQPDTTSHDFTFVIDTLGNNELFPSHLWDVFAVNENDVWVVGEINTVDTGFDSLGNFTPPYSAAHWDGNKWEYVRFYQWLNGKRSNLGDINGIWIFSKDNVWIASGAIFHKEGAYFYRKYKNNPDAGEMITKLWAASENEIYGVGTRGLIVKYDGNSWTRMESGTDVDLLNVWGEKDKKTGQTHVFAAGSRGDRQYGVVLEMKNGQWLHRFDEKHPVFGKEDDHTAPIAVWGYRDCLYVSYSGYDSDNVYRHSIANFERDFSLMHSETMGAISSISGIAQNDFFLVGFRDVVLHYNGKSFKKYFQFPYVDARYYSVKQKGKYVFACGEIFGYAIAIVLRGERK